MHQSPSVVAYGKAVNLLHLLRLAPLPNFVSPSTELRFGILVFVFLVIIFLDSPFDIIALIVNAPYFCLRTRA